MGWKKESIACIVPNNDRIFRNDPVYKCALPQTHLPFKLSETRRKKSTSLFPASSGAMNAGPGPSSALRFPPSACTLSSDCRPTGQRPRPDRQCGNGQGGASAPHRRSVRIQVSTAACQPPDTPLKTLSVFLHKVALKVRKINLVCLGANLGPTLRAP